MEDLIHPTNLYWPGGVRILTEEEAYMRGRDRGEYWAGKGEIYQAGGPFCGGPNRPGFSALEAAEKHAHAAWIRGWKDGQNRVVEKKQSYSREETFDEMSEKVDS